jgi:hypothetical protein
MKNCLYRFAMLAFVLFAAAACDGEKGAVISNQNSNSSASAIPSEINSASGVYSSDTTNALPVKLKIVQKLNYDWSGDGNGYEFILSIPEPWDDAGDFTELQIARNGKVVYALSDQSGLVKYQSELGSKKIVSTQNLLSSTYLFMSPSKEKTALPVLFVFGWAYGSSPGSLRVIALNNDGIPKEVFYRENFMVTAFADLNSDSRMDLIGKECFSQGWGPDLLTYDPFTVFRFDEELSSPMMLDLALSEAYNKKEYYGWAGPKCREDVAVVMHPPGNGKPVIMDAKDAEALFTKK